MLNEARSAVKKYAAENKKAVSIILLLSIGIFLLSISSSSFSKQETYEAEETLDEYKMRMESELSDICSSVSGVGKCRVTLTFERGEERVYKGSSLIESRPPKVMGVTVVCRGADSDIVKGEIVRMMSALFDIGANRIAVLKLNS